MPRPQTRQWPREETRAASPRTAPPSCPQETVVGACDILLKVKTSRSSLPSASAAPAIASAARPCQVAVLTQVPYCFCLASEVPETDGQDSKECCFVN